MTSNRSWSQIRSGNKGRTRPRALFCAKRNRVCAFNCVADVQTFVYWIRLLDVFDINYSGFIFFKTIADLICDFDVTV